MKVQRSHVAVGEVFSTGADEGGTWLTENVNQDFTHLIFHFSVHCQCADRATDTHLCSHDLTAMILE